jgi:beta-glucosidase
MLVPEGIPGETYFAAFPMSIDLDGELMDWEGVPKVTIPEDVDLEMLSSAVTFAAVADDTHLFFMADVLDNNIISGEHGPDYWNEDSIEFYVNGTGDLNLTTYIDGVAQITIPALNIDLPSNESIVAGVRGDTVDANVAARKSDHGYAVEISVPLRNDVWNILLGHGATVGFQVHLNGATTLNRDSKLIWSVFDTSDRSYVDPSVFGQLIFYEIGREEIVQIEPTLTPTFIPVEENATYRQSDIAVETRVEDVLARMTLAEKIGQMTLVEKNSIEGEAVRDNFIGGILSGGGGYPEQNTPESWAEMVNGFQQFALESHLGIPILYGVDAVHGHNNVYGAVIFPHNISLGAAADPDLTQRIAQVTAEEMAATGIYWNYAPVLAVPQDIRWGRTYEAFSEDPTLVTTLTTAYLRGLQGGDLAELTTVLGTPKHFVGDGGTTWGSSTTLDYQIDQGVTEVDEATLRSVHLSPYLDAIQTGAMSIMISYSSWDGMKMHAQQYLITDVLKGELGFEGFVVSDWAGIDQISGDYYQAVVTAINAGIDMNMVPYDYMRFIGTLTRAVEAGDVPVDRIDDAVRRILTVKFELGLFEYPFANQELLASVGSQDHREVAREAVRKSLVLLKNERNILPLPKDLSLIYVSGLGANDIGVQSGGWTIEWQGAIGPITPGTTILEAIEQTVSPETVVVYDKFGNFKGEGGAEPPVADVCIAVIGEEPYAEGIGDREDLSLSVSDKRMLRRLETPCEMLVVILIAGRPMMVTEFIDSWDAFIVAWLPGTEGQGIADVLFGDYPFTGKLPFTWPRAVEQLPQPWLASDPLFRFGFGLTH